MRTKFWPESLKRRDHSKEPHVGSKNNVNIYITEIGFGGLNWIYLAQDMDRWLALVKPVMKYRLQEMQVFLT
jgi:hypothetical protein